MKLNKTGWPLRWSLGRIKLMFLYSQQHLSAQHSHVFSVQHGAELHLQLHLQLHFSLVMIPPG
jgi:hypothetical protein